ncbi:hypothetical protein TNCV_298241 [Trichonephila clavipes]|nr:hypothetical protein TNCV_298241 [Trichonephila clavipes]
MTSTGEPNPVEARGGGLFLNSQYRATSGRADHQYLFFFSVGMWGKIYTCGCVASQCSLLSPKVAESVLSLIVRFQSRYMRHLRIYRIIYLIKPSRINCKNRYSSLAGIDVL